MKEPLIYFNKQSLNGHTYRLEGFKELDLTKPLYVERNNSDTPDVQLHLLCGQVVDMEVIDDALIGKFIPMSNYIRTDNTVIRTMVIGKVDECGYVSDAVITKLYFVASEDDAFKDCSKNI